MAFFLFVAEFDFGRNGCIVDFCIDSLGDGYVVRGLDEWNLQVLGKFVVLIRVIVI